MTNHEFTITSTWQGGLDGHGKLSANTLDTAVSAPQDLGGSGVGTNPEELLAAAAAACYQITLAAILQRRGIPVHSVKLTTSLKLARDPGLRVERIIHRPELILAAGASAEHLTSAREALGKAEKACLVSNALRGNVALSVDGDVKIE